MHQQFMAAVRQLCNEKNLPEEIIIDIVKSALKTAYRKDYGTKDQILDVDIDEKTEHVAIYVVKTVVDEVEDEEIEISLEDARKLNKSIKVEEEVRIDVTPLSYGRIAAQAAKQVIIQRIQEAERDHMYEAFKDRENELVNALIHRVDSFNVYVELGGITTILPRREQIRTEQYYGGQRIKLYLDRVVKTTKGPELRISRTHPNLVRKLMELEIPEIKAGTVEIKAVSREPGVRCKVAVHSTDEQIDPIGACVGNKGVRIQGITRELAGERIDVIPWSENPAEYIQDALKPAKIAKVLIDEEKKLAQVYVGEDQRALAIGKGGQNVRLASKLTGWEIDILDQPGGASSQSSEEGDAVHTPDTDQPLEEAQQMMITALNIDDSIKEKLSSVGLEQVAQLKGLSAKDFMQVEGVTDEEAELIVAAVKEAL